MFGVGWQEMLVIFGILALLFGPRQLPKMAESLGKTLHIIRRDAREFQKEIDEGKDEIAKASKDFQSMKDATNDIKKAAQSAASVKEKISR